MNDLTPRAPTRPLIWPDAILDIAEMLADSPQPVHIVGGAVRDAYFGAPLHDCDLVVPTGASALARRIANQLDGDVYVMDTERDVARVLAVTSEGKLAIDVAAYRAQDLLNDLIERDFTVNAMAVDMRDPTMLIDPLNGEHDLKQKLIRRCSEYAVARDPIRALRAVRQSIQLSAHIDKATMLDVRANASRLYDTSPERVRDEFVKILATSRPHAALRIQTALGLLAPILPEFASLPELVRDRAFRVVEHTVNILNVVSPKRTDNTAAAFGLGAMVVALDLFRHKLQDHIAMEWANERPHRSVLHLATLLRTVVEHEKTMAPAAYIDHVVEHLRLSNQERTRLIAAVSADTGIVTDTTSLADLDLHRYWYGLGNAGVDALILSLARYLADSGVGLEQDEWVRTLERARLLLEAFYLRHDRVVAPPAVIDGNELMAALALKPGPIMRILLDRIREAQVTGEVTDRDSAIAEAREYLDAQPPKGRQ